jgi:zinc protease
MDRSRPPEPGAVRTFNFPRVERRRLDNGLTLLVARSGALPIVTISAVLDAGAASEREGEEGLAWLTAQALEGGTRQHSGDDLAWALERLGAELDTRATWDTLHASLTAPAARRTDAVALLGEVVREPAFPAREVERLRDEQLAEMLRRRTEPRGLADDSAAHFIFDAASPYSRSLLGVEKRVQGFDAAAVTAFHNRRFTPGNAAVVAVGDIDPDEAQRQVESAFGAWTTSHEAVPPVAAEPGLRGTRIHIVHREGAVQSELRIGHVGVPRHHEDYYTLLVTNALIGGAFTSRLNLSLREKHGFTYGVRSTFAFRRGAGPFVIQTAVASDVTARAVEETLKELRSVQESGVTEDEVRAARDYIAGTLPLGMQTTEQLSSLVADLHTFDLPEDYFEHYRRGIAAVAREDVVRAARSHLRLDELAIVVVGDANAIEAPLREVGEVEVHR